MLPSESENVLLCMRYGIGDAVMELPALEALREALPDARITALTNSPAGQLLEDDGRVGAVVSTDRWGLSHRWDRGDEPTRAAIAAWVRRQGFDLFLDASYAMMAAGEAIWSLGVRSLEASVQAERRVLGEGGSGVQAILAAAREGWGMHADPGLRPALELGPSRHHAAAALLRQHGVDDARPFAVCPVASSPLKRWPAERFAAVADRVVERHGGTVLVLEGPQKAEGAAVVSAMEHGDRTVRIGAEHLLTTAALLARCSGLVVNDTGIMHIADAVGTPTIGVFGPTRADFFLPPGASAHAIEPHGLECGYRETRSLSPPPCWREGRCLISDEPCTHRSRLGDVIDAVNRALGQGAPPRRHPDGLGNAACVRRATNRDPTRQAHGSEQTPRPGRAPSAAFRGSAGGDGPAGGRRPRIVPAPG